MKTPRLAGSGSTIEEQQEAPGGRAAKVLDSGVLSRRRFLVAGSGAAGWLLAGGGVLHADLAAAELPFRQPAEIKSQDGRLRQTLRVIEETLSIPSSAGERLEVTRTYNGGVPGPTLRIRPGEILELELRNDLPPNPDSGSGRSGHNVPGRFNTTNLHTHGLHVSPSGDSDNVFVEVEPGDSHQYRVHLPDFHAPGTHWYHGHRHGSTAVQMVNGLHGALIVEEPPGQAIAVDAEKLWVVQEIVGREAAAVYTCQPPQVPFTVNGLLQPTLTMRPGEIQRWRFLLAGGTQRAFMNLQLVDTATGSEVPLQLIAVDGIGFYGRPPQSHPSWQMAPGNRADFLVQLEAGTYQVLKGAAQDGPDQVLATVRVTGEPFAPRSLPELPPLAARPDYLRPITDQEIDGRPERRFEFSVKHLADCAEQPVGAAVPAKFLINGKQYGEPGTATRLQLDTAEQWLLTNTSFHEHPFHIHVNPFQVVEPDLPPEEWLWWDTIAIPEALSAATLGRVTIRHRFTTFTGKFVLHCHVLAHEDLGMMQDVEVVAPANAESPVKPANENSGGETD